MVLRVRRTMNNRKYLRSLYVDEKGVLTKKVNVFDQTCRKNDA